MRAGPMRAGLMRAGLMRAGLMLVAACAPAAAPRTPADARPMEDAAAGTKPAPLATGASPHDPWVPAQLPVATAMEADLKELGLDPKALPPLGKLEASTLRKVMRTFTRSLGVPCAACHDVKDFRAPTPKKTIATHMWNDFARGLAMRDGSPLYCDSCHGGKATFLDRSDRKELAGWMRRAFVEGLDVVPRERGPLARTDGKEHNCATCHGEPFEGDIFGKRWSH